MPLAARTLPLSAFSSSKPRNRSDDQGFGRGPDERRPDDGDGRGVLAVQTERGREAFEEMERSHARSIRSHFSTHLDEQEAAAIAACFRRIADHGREALAIEPPQGHDADEAKATTSS